jgi:formate transporter
MSAEFSIDAFPPAKMASRLEDVGVTKSKLNIWTMFALAILAGAFIGVGAIFSTTALAGTSTLPYGVARLLGGLVFTTGLILVVVGGAELFTGNNLILIAFASGKVSWKGLLRNWIVVYLGNLVGSVITAYIMFLSKQYSFGSGSIGLTALNIGQSKTSLDFVQAVALGIMCNALVCMAVWMCFSARTTTDKILSIIPPISAFVAAGFEHSVANMYFIPIALFIKYMGDPKFFETIKKTAADFPALTWPNFFLVNLLPVTIGNIIGGGVMVGLVYWFIYLRPQKTVAVKPGVAARLLVVDDDRDFVDVTRAILTKAGYAVDRASNGEEALKIMKQAKPDMVLLDVMMTTPLEGVSVARQMAADPVLKSVPIVMMSSIDDTKYRTALPDDMRIPIDAWINKPVDPDQMLKTIKRFLR